LQRPLPPEASGRACGFHGRSKREDGSPNSSPNSNPGRPTMTTYLTVSRHSQHEPMCSASHSGSYLLARDSWHGAGTDLRARMGSSSNAILSHWHWPCSQRIHVFFDTLRRFAHCSCVSFRSLLSDAAADAGLLGSLGLICLLFYVAIVRPLRSRGGPRNRRGYQTTTHLDNARRWAGPSHAC